MKRLDVGQIMALHQLLLEETGGSPGLRDIGLLDSATNAPYATYDGHPMYPSLEGKAARLGYGIIKNHPFIDGNKRIGLLAMLVLLEINGLYLDYDDNELITLGLSLADGDIDDKALCEWIIQHSPDNTV